MNASTLRRAKIFALILIGCVVGLAVGADLALRYAFYRQIECTKELENYYIESHLMELSLSIMTMKKAEIAQAENIISDQRTRIRFLFLTIINIYKQGHFKSKENDIRNVLIKAHEFMAARPSLFIEEKFCNIKPINFINDPKEEVENERATKEEREQLQAGFDFVSKLESKNKTEPGAAANASRR